MFLLSSTTTLHLSCLWRFMCALEWYFVFLLYIEVTIAFTMPSHLSNKMCQKYLLALDWFQICTTTLTIMYWYIGITRPCHYGEELDVAVWQCAFPTAKLKSTKISYSHNIRMAIPYQITKFKYGEWFNPSGQNFLIWLCTLVAFLLNYWIKFARISRICMVIPHPNTLPN